MRADAILSDDLIPFHSMGIVNIVDGIKRKSAYKTAAHYSGEFNDKWQAVCTHGRVMGTADPSDSPPAFARVFLGNLLIHLHRALLGRPADVGESTNGKDCAQHYRLLTFLLVNSME